MIHKNKKMLPALVAALLMPVGLVFAQMQVEADEQDYYPEYYEFQDENGQPLMLERDFQAEAMMAYPVCSGERTYGSSSSMRGSTFVILLEGIATCNAGVFGYSGEAFTSAAVGTDLTLELQARGSFGLWQIVASARSDEWGNVYVPVSAAINAGQGYRWILRSNKLPGNMNFNFSFNLRTPE